MSRRRSDARLWVPRRAPRSARYQIARFCSSEGETPDGYSYTITPESLEHARSNGLKVGQLLALLKKYAEATPPNLGRALDRWEEHGTEARFQQALVLRLATPDLLQALRNSRAARFLGDPLGPTTVIVKANTLPKVIAVLAEMGYLSEVRQDDGLKNSPE